MDRRGGAIKEDRAGGLGQLTGAIGANNQFNRPVALRKLGDKVGTNPCGFAGSDNNTLHRNVPSGSLLPGYAVNPSVCWGDRSTLWHVLTWCRGLNLVAQNFDVALARCSCIQLPLLQRICGSSACGKRGLSARRRFCRRCGYPSVGLGASRRRSEPDR